MKKVYIRWSSVGYLLAAFVAGSAVGLALGNGAAAGAIGAPGILRLSDPEHKLISPLLLSDSGRPADQDIVNKLKVGTYDLLDLPNMQSVSIYFRDLKSGVWAGIDENAQYNPASLLKVPIMIAWFKKAEDNPALLENRYIYSAPIDPLSEQGTALKIGTSYTVEELISYMIRRSDNAAKDLLLVNLDDATINAVFTDLGIKEWGTAPGDSEHISPAIYSRFLRILYNASYLNRDYSERALELLSSTDFNTGLVAGVPEGVAVAHKYGDYEDSSAKITELHDCGIVYHPTDPYLLCVMTRGTADVGISDLENVIKTTSKTVYSIVDSDLSKRGN